MRPNLPISRSSLPYFVAGLLLCLLVGCSPKTGPDQESSPGIGNGWEIAWVDPQIVSSDQFHTLIYASRVDSMKVAGFEPRVAPGTVFYLDTDTCLVTADLLDLNDRIVMPLIVRRLPIGWYKLTLTPTPPKDLNLPPGTYVVEIGRCGQVSRTTVVLQ